MKVPKFATNSYHTTMMKRHGNAKEIQPQMDTVFSQKARGCLMADVRASTARSKKGLIFPDAALLKAEYLSWMASRHWHNFSSGINDCNTMTSLLPKKPLMMQNQHIAVP